MLAVVVAALLVVATLLGHYAPLQAQEGEAPEATGASGVSIRMDDLVGLITYSIVHRFEVQVSHLDAAATYDVVVSSSNASALGIGGCGTAAQTATVTGATTQTLYFIVYACGVGAGTVTAEVRRAGAATAEVAVSQGVTAAPIPDWVPDDERPVRGASGAVAQVGTPGFVKNPRLEQIMTTSVVATWDTPTGNGGVDLSGYGLLFWHEDEEHPSYRDDVLVKGLIPREHTYTGLQHDATYKFRIHACNKTPACGWWTNPPLEVTTELAPNPHRPHTIRFSQISSDSVRVRWSAAANTGGVPLTGFDLRYWPYDPDNPDEESGAIDHPADDGNDRGETLKDLAAGTEYELKMRACNGPKDSHCSTWSADHRFTTTAGTGAPGPVKNLDVDPGNRQLVVSWEAPDSDGGTAITGYEVGYREHQTEPNWTSWPHDGTGTTVTITDRTNGTRYDVRVRACNHPVGATARCSQDWVIGHGTPEAPRPRNLSVVPKVGRKAELTWDPVPNTAMYQVQAGVLGTSAWQAAECEGDPRDMPGIVAKPICVMDLDDIAEISGSLAGLATYKAFALQVRALRPLASKYSEPVAIIDTPIFRAKGASGSVDVKWTPVDTVHTEINAGGMYQLRYRRFRGDHRSDSWNPETEGFDSTTPTSLLAAGSTSRRIGSLDNEGLYAIQLVYHAPQPGGLPTPVFAARDAYAWPSDRAAGVGTDITGDSYAGERVGTFPLNKPVSNRTYEYYICSDTFPLDIEPDVPDDPDPPDGIRAKSRAFIRDAFSQWETATTTGTGGSLITMKYMGTTCADYAPLIKPIVNKINSSVTEGRSPSQITMDVESVIQQLGDLGGILNQDKERSEVIFVDVPVEERSPPTFELTKRYIFFSEVSHRIGLNKCVFRHGVEACAMDEELNGVITTDILLNGKQFEKTNYFNWDVPPDVDFNTCRGLTNAAHTRYAAVVHEAGHALGIRGTQRSGGDGQEIHHPHVADSALTHSSYSCSPTPFDVMAIYALYQAQE